MTRRVPGRIRWAIRIGNGQCCSSTRIRRDRPERKERGLRLALLNSEELVVLRDLPL